MLGYCRRRRELKKKEKRWMVLATRGGLGAGREKGLMYCPLSLSADPISCDSDVQVLAYERGVAS
jgi:hypothetical protein